VVAIRTLDEDAQFRAAGFNPRMPSDWGEKDAPARYRAEGIEIIESPVDEVFG